MIRTCAFGIADYKHGNDLLTIAILNENKDIKVTEDEIISVFKKELADFKQIRGGVYFLDQFPMTPSGKVKRNEVKNIVTELYKEKK